VFIRYATIGIFNTGIHWTVFFSLHHWADLSQAVANLIAFCVAVTFSFFMNVRYTFRTIPQSSDYFHFVLFMAALSLITGLIADYFRIFPLFTMIFFPAISLLFGYAYSRYIIFKKSRET